MTSVYTCVIGSFSVSNVQRGMAEKGGNMNCSFIRRRRGTLRILKGYMVILCWRARGVSEEQALFYRRPLVSWLLFLPFSESEGTLRTRCRTRGLLRSLFSPPNSSPGSKEKRPVPDSGGSSTETSGRCVCVEQRDASASTLSPHPPKLIIKTKFY